MTNWRLDNSSKIASYAAKVRCVYFLIFGSNYGPLTLAWDLLILDDLIGFLVHYPYCSFHLQNFPCWAHVLEKGFKYWPEVIEIFHFLFWFSRRSVSSNSLLIYVSFLMVMVVSAILGGSPLINFHSWGFVFAFDFFFYFFLFLFVQATSSKSFQFHTFILEPLSFDPHSKPTQSEYLVLVISFS